MIIEKEVPIKKFLKVIKRYRTSLYKYKYVKLDYIVWGIQLDRFERYKKFKLSSFKEPKRIFK